ncbi:MAG: transglycosylase SLT domain-containing protein [Desulfomonilaceae bacterium]
MNRKYGNPANLFFNLGAGLLAGILFLGTPCEPSYAAEAPGYSRANYILPPDVQKQGVTFAGVRIPIDRHEVSSRVVDQINYLLMDRRAIMMGWFDRMGLYGPMIRQVLTEQKVPSDLIYLAAVLSDLLPNFRNRAGGVGWWALGSIKSKKDSSSGQWIVTDDWDDRRDPTLSTRIASTILQGILRRKSGSDWLLTICAFVDGADNIDVIMSKAKGFSYWDMVMPSYSEVIIPRLVALKIIDTHKSFYGVAVPPLPPLSHDFLGRLKLLKDLPLYVVANWCNTNARAIWELNPGVDPSTGVLPKADKRSPLGFPLRVPKGLGRKVKRSLMHEGYLAN